jgi:hypothetical protein
MKRWRTSSELGDGVGAQKSGAAFAGEAAR